MPAKHMSVEPKNTGTRRYITGFDGLRVLALLGVIFYHLLPFAVPGGYLGVPIFFAVSGYLITDIFIQEWDRTGKIKVGSFYVRRLKRLYPTLLTILIGSSAYMTLFAQNLLSHIRNIIWTNLVFVYNWWLVGNGQSYFDRYNGESPFTHLWYLSVLAQYYFIWPIVMIILLKLFSDYRPQIGLFLTVLAVGSAILMAILYNPQNINRVYYGTEARMAPYLLGAALAFVWPSTRLSANNINSSTRVKFNIIGLISFIIMTFLFFVMPGTTPWPYHGGMFLFSFISVMMIAIIAHPAFMWNSLLSNKLFKWIGSRSYGIYMYQLPVMVFYEQAVKNIAEHPVINSLVQIVIILILSELSYRFIEVPVAKFNFANIRELFNVLTDFKRGINQVHLKTLTSLLVLAVATVGILMAPEKVPQKTDGLKQELSKNNKDTDKNNAAALKKQAQQVSEKKVKLTKADKKIIKDYHLTDHEFKVASTTPLTGVGDSVLEDTAPKLQDVFKSAYMSAQVGRQIDSAEQELQDLKSQGKLSKNVLINIGANGNVTAHEMKKVIKLVGPKRHIFWVNVHVPTKIWEKSVNRNLMKVQKENKNFTVVDWYGASQDKTEWFYGDNVHPNPTGSKEYTTVVVKKVVSTLDKK